MVNKSGPICSMPGCDKPMKYKVRKLCSSCYSFKYYWGKKTSAQIMKRMSNLERWHKRMETLVPATVSRITKKRKRA